MVEGAAVRALLRSSRSDAAVLVVTAIATVALDLVTAVVLGIIAAGGLALRKMAQATTLEQVPLTAGDHTDEERELLDHRIVAYRLDGPLFFGGAHQALLELTSLADVKVVILRMSRVATLDATGAAVLRDTITTLEDRGITVMLSGVPDRHSPVLDALGVYDSLAHERHLFETTPQAIAHARVHAARIPHTAAPAGTDRGSDSAARRAGPVCRPGWSASAPHPGRVMKQAAADGRVVGIGTGARARTPGLKECDKE